MIRRYDRNLVVGAKTRAEKRFRMKDQTPTNINQTEKNWDGNCNIKVIRPIQLFGERRYDMTQSVHKARSVPPALLPTGTLLEPVRQHL